MNKYQRANSLKISNLKKIAVEEWRTIPFMIGVDHQSLKKLIEGM